MLYELYTFEYLKDQVYNLNKMLVGTGYELIYEEARGKKSRDTLKIKDPNAKYTIVMQFNRTDDRITSFGTNLMYFASVYVKPLQEQEVKYQQTKKRNTAHNIKSPVCYDGGFMRVSNDFPGFSFVNKIKYVQPAIIIECILNIINKILKGEII